MDLHPNHEITDYYAPNDSQLSVETPQVVITGEEVSDELAGTGDEANIDTSIVGVSELRTEAEPAVVYTQPLVVIGEHPDEATAPPVTVHEDPPLLAQAAGTIAFSAGESTGDVVESDADSSEVESPVDHSTDVTNDLGSESAREPDPENQIEVQEDDPQVEPLTGGGDGIDPPNDNVATGAAEGDENPDRAGEPLSAASTQAIWDIGKVLIDAQGEIGPFPVGEFEDGTVRYDDDFPGMRIYDFHSDIVAEAGYPEGTEVKMSETPPQSLDMFTEKYEQHDPLVHSEPPDTQHLLQVTIDSEVEGVFYSGQLDIVVDSDGGLESNYVQRSGVIGGGERRAPDKPFDEYTQEEMATFVEGSREYVQSMQDEGDFHGFSEADGARLLRLFGLAILREERN